MIDRLVMLALGIAIGGAAVIAGALSPPALKAVDCIMGGGGW